MSSAPRLAVAVADAQHARWGVLLDLRDVTYFGSAGLSVLVESTRRAAEVNGKLAVLTRGDGLPEEAMHLTGLDTVLHLFSDPAAAAEFLHPDTTSPATTV